jgi:hypothetical protein
MARQHYTANELDSHAIADQLNDAECAERQAEHGPFFPEKGITRESCLKYAAECRARIARYRSGGMHKAILSPVADVCVCGHAKLHHYM